jgi:hypothetical protein
LIPTPSDRAAFRIFGDADLRIAEGSAARPRPAPRPLHWRPKREHYGAQTGHRDIIMKRLLLAAAAAITLIAGAGQAEAAHHSRPPGVKVGVLSCDVAPGVGYVVGSSKQLVCWFHGDGYRRESYRGRINKFGLDVGVTHHTRIEWLVFAATRSRYTPHALAGEYVGASAEGTIGVGVGANWLIGGSHRSFALQPVSVQAQTGFDLSLALSNLSLW